MSKWNHRILRFKEDNFFVYQIHEVYYDKDKNLTGYTESPVKVIGLSMKSIAWTLKYMKKCMSKPIIDGNNFPNEIN